MSNANAMITPAVNTGTDAAATNSPSIAHLEILREPGRLDRDHAYDVAMAHVGHDVPLKVEPLDAFPARLDEAERRMPDEVHGRLPAAEVPPAAAVNLDPCAAHDATPYRL